MWRQFTFKYHSKSPEADGDITCNIPADPDHGTENKVEIEEMAFNIVKSSVEVEVQEMTDF